MTATHSDPAAPSILDSPFPLVFRIGGQLDPGARPDPVAGMLSLRTLTRALSGMQKEAIVSHASGSWRMVCDEGPYLNGTDLAPFPLAFFTAGLAADVMSGLRTRLADHGIDPGGLELIQDNRYTMEGSALRGTMTGGALPVGLTLQHEHATDQAVLRRLLSDAVAASPACALLRDTLTNRFSIHHNGRSIATGRVRSSDSAGLAPPTAFSSAMPDEGWGSAVPAIEKLEGAPVLFGIEGGAGSSLQPEQKRQLHVRGVCHLREDGLQSIRVQLLNPIGSVFQFLAEDSAAGTGRAPSGLTYLSAGIAFCFMTQLGRYAQIVGRPIHDYRLIQDTTFSPSGAPPITTHAFVNSNEDDAYARQLIDMGEQTCFLHAACRSRVDFTI